jgi:hypothetical protein
VFVALVIQHAMRMPRIVLSSVACLVLPYFPTLFHNRYDFWGNVIEHVTFISQLMHSIITVLDVKIMLYKSLKDTHQKLLQHVSDHIGSIIRE